MATDWWKGAVVYQIYPRSFQDDNGDGIGDLNGITRRLPHVADLGADAIWLSPVFTSPMADMGYDVSDYKGIDPTFGTLADFDALVARAHDLGLKVIIDLVISHSSDRHPFFTESRASRKNPKASWYVWADPKPDGTPPNNWQSIFGGPAWQWDTRRRQYYMHNFLREQPDFNMHEPAVQDYLLGVLRFWLDRGVDGFRLDTVNFYFHDPKLRDQPPLGRKARARAFKPYDMQDPIRSKNQPENIAFLERLRALTDEYDNRAMVGEVGCSVYPLDLMAEYTTGKRLHMAYSFDMLGPDFTARHFRSRIETFFKTAPAGWPSWSFSNHDVPRHVGRWLKHGADQDSIARLSIAMLAAFEGTIGLYQGEELGQADTALSFDELTDPQGIEFWPADKGRDGCRTPMVWEAAAPHAGFTAGRPWLPVKAPQAARAVSEQAAGNDSVLGTYKSVLAYRRARPALKTGRTAFIDLPEPVLAFHRGKAADRVTCVFNLSPGPVRLTVEGALGTAGPAFNIRRSGKTLTLGPNGFAFYETAGAKPPVLRPATARAPAG